MDLSPAIRAFLEEKRFAVLATIGSDGVPQQSVMWYVLDGNDILMNTKRGRAKDANLLRDPRLSLCFEDEYRWLTLVGRAELIDEQAIAQADIRRLAVRYHGPERAARQAQDQFEKETRVTIRVKIERVIADGF